LMSLRAADRSSEFRRSGWGMNHFAGSSLWRSGRECDAYCMGMEERVRYFGTSWRCSGHGEWVTKVRVMEVIQGKWSDVHERVVYAGRIEVAF